MFTHSGRIITLHSGVPTIRDVAIHLSKIPRWAGGTHETWSVAHHSLACMSLAKSPPDPKTEGVRGCTTDGTLISSPGESLEGAGVLLLSLWHDAHEFATEDVPPPFKPDSVRDLQQMLDERMWLELFDLQQLPADVQKWVKWLDAVLTSTEARMLMHPDVGRHFPKKSNAAEAAINLWRGIPSEWIADYFVDDTRKLLKEIKLGR